jgi:16S rRNA (uracil1498-N3)-methyltransferase
MSLRTRLYVDQELALDSKIILDEAQSHYIIHVLRGKPGELYRVFNQQSGEWEAEFIRGSKKETVLNINRLLKECEPTPQLHLAFAPIKNATASFIVQKATELGVTDIWPIITTRTVVNKVNHEKLILAATEASEQSERLDIPTVHPITKLSEFIKLKPFSGTLIFCYEGEKIRKIDKINISLPPKDNCLLIGPEGGFTLDEVELLKKHEYVIPVSFGARIMRAETAFIAALSAYNTITNNW